jgi:hypothetical protein
MNFPISFDGSYLTVVDAGIGSDWSDFMYYGVNCPSVPPCGYDAGVDGVYWYAAVCLDVLGCFPPPNIGEPSLIGYVTFEVTNTIPENSALIDTFTYPPVNSPIFGNTGGTESCYPSWPGPIIACPTGVSEKTSVPKKFFLEEMGPNPFRTTTGIRYGLPKKSEVVVSIYNVSGRLVKTLYRGVQDAGTYTLEWNATDELGRPVASGTYFLRMEAGSFNALKRLMVLR